nr:unnamed protein product [Callosobruchus analis]
MNYKNIKVNELTMGDSRRCRTRCFLRIPEEDRRQVFVKTKNEQGAYLQALIECTEISKKRPRVRRNIAKPKSKSYRYLAM